MGTFDSEWRGGLLRAERYGVTPNLKIVREWNS